MWSLLTVAINAQWQFVCLSNHCSWCWKPWWSDETASGSCRLRYDDIVGCFWRQNNTDLLIWNWHIAFTLFLLSSFIDFSLSVSPTSHSWLKIPPHSLHFVPVPYPAPPPPPPPPLPPHFPLSINPQPGAGEGIRDQVSEAGRLNDSFHSRHSGIVDFSSPAGTDSRRRRRREEIGLLFVSFLFTLVYLPLTKLSVRSYQLLSVYLIPLLAVFPTARQQLSHTTITGWFKSIHSVSAVPVSTGLMHWRFFFF